MTYFKRKHDIQYNRNNDEKKRSNVDEHHTISKITITGAGELPMMQRKIQSTNHNIQMKPVEEEGRSDRKDKDEEKAQERTYGSLDYKAKIRFDPELEKGLGGNLTGDRLKWYLTKGRDILNVGREYNLDTKQLMMIASQSRQEQIFKLKTVGNFFGIETDDEQMGIGLNVSRAIGTGGKASKHAKGHLMDFSRNGKYYNYLYKKSKDKSLSKEERKKYSELKEWIYRQGDVGEESVIRAYLHYIKGEIDPFEGGNEDWKGFRSIDKVLFDEKSSIHQFAQAVIGYASVGYGQAILSFHQETIRDFKTVMIAQIKRDEEQIIRLQKINKRAQDYQNEELRRRRADESYIPENERYESIENVIEQNEVEIQQRLLNLFFLRERMSQLEIPRE